MKPRICFVVSTPATAKSFLFNHMMALSKSYEVTLIANFKDNPGYESDFPGVSVIDVRIFRKISLLWDLRALFELYTVFRQERYAAVFSITPKAGLLSMLASRMAGIECRIHNFSGQVWLTQKGLFRLLLKTMDTLTFKCAKFVLVDCLSQRDFLIAEKVITAHKSGVLANGSTCGVDLERFKPNILARDSVRAELSLAKDAFIFLFLGRVNIEKGIAELLEAFGRLDFTAKDAYLLIIGPEEDTVLADNAPAVASLGKHFIRMGYTEKPEYYMAAVDLFCLPSHREGFGTVIIESAAVGVPALASNIYGISDSVEDGRTGILHNKQDVTDITVKMNLLLDDRKLLASLAESAQIRAVQNFSRDVLTQAMVDFFQARVRKL